MEKESEKLMKRKKNSLLTIFFIVFAISAPYFNMKNFVSISYYYGADCDKQLPGYPNTSNFGSYPGEKPFILRVRAIKLTLWPGTGRIDAQMSFDIRPRWGDAAIMEQWLWGDSYEAEPIGTTDDQVFFAEGPTNEILFENTQIRPLVIYTNSIWDDNGYSTDFTFYFQYWDEGGFTYKYCVFAVYFARSGLSYLPLTSELGAFATHQPHLYLT